MVDCPTCGWPMVKRREYETGGYVFAHYICKTGAGQPCPTNVQVKSPTAWMKERGRWE